MLWKPSLENIFGPKPLVVNLQNDFKYPGLGVILLNERSTSFLSSFCLLNTTQYLAKAAWHTKHFLQPLKFTCSWLWSAMICRLDYNFQAAFPSSDPDFFYSRLYCSPHHQALVVFAQNSKQFLVPAAMLQKYLAVSMARHLRNWSFDALLASGIFIEGTFCWLKYAVWL